MPRLVRRFIWPWGLFIWSYGKHTIAEARPITYGNGRGHDWLFSSPSLSPFRALYPPFLRLSLSLFPFSRSSNALIAAGNRGLSQHERSMNPRPLVFSTFYLPPTRSFLPPSLACCFLRYFCTRVCLLVFLLSSISFEISLGQNRFTASSITLWIAHPRASWGLHFSRDNKSALFFFLSSRVNSNFLLFRIFLPLRKDWQERLREEGAKHDAKPRTLSAFRGLGMYERSRRKPR